MITDLFSLVPINRQASRRKMMVFLFQGIRILQYKLITLLSQLDLNWQIIFYYNSMDRQSPTSIRYSYTNTSNTDSVNISRSLQRSSNTHSNETLSARIGIYDYASGNNLDSGPIIQHPSESAQSSSVPSQYMGESSTIEVQRTVRTSSQQSHIVQGRPQNSNNMNQTVQPAGQNLSIANSGSFQYQVQIQQLKLLLHKQTQESQNLHDKYERCLEQMNSLFQQNQQLKLIINDKKGSLNLSRNYLENSKMSEISRTKQDQIRRLKDSNIVLKKQKDSFEQQAYQLMNKVNQMQKKNDQYEDKLVLLSHQLQRINRMNKEKTEEKNKISKQNQKLNAEIAYLRQQLQKINMIKLTQHEKNSVELSAKIQSLYSQLQKFGKIKLQLQSQIRKLTNQNKGKQQQFSIIIEKFRVEGMTAKRQIQNLQSRNQRLEQQLKNLHLKNSSSQIQLSNVSSQTNQLQSIIRQLEQKLVSLQRDYNIQLQKIVNLQNDYKQMKRRNTLSEQQNKKIRLQCEKYQQQSIQLRRKIQQISINSEKSSANMGENMKQRERFIQQLQSKIHEVQIKFSEQVRSTQMKTRQFQEHKRILQATNHDLQLRLQQSQYKIKQSQFLCKQVSSQNQQLQNLLKERQSKIKNLEQSLKQFESKQFGLGNQLHKLQTVHNSLITQKSLEQSRLRQQFTFQLSDFQNRINSSNMQKNELQAKLQNQTKENYKLQQQLQNYKGATAELQNKVKVLESALQSNRQQYIYLQKSHGSLQSQLKSQIQTTRQLSNRLTKDTQIQKSQYFQQIARRDSFLLQLQQKILEQQSFVSSLNMKLQQKDNTISENMSHIDKYKQQSLHYQQQLKSIKVDFNHLVQELQFLKQANISKQKAYGQAKDQLSANLQQKQTKINEKNEQLWKLQSEFNNLVVRYQQMQQQNKAIKQNSNLTQNQLVNYVRKLESMERQYRQCLEMIRIKDREAGQYKSGAQRLQQKYRQLERQNNQVVLSLGRLQQRNKILQREYTNNTSNLSQRQKILEKQNGEYKAIIYKLQQKSRQLQLQLRQLEHEHQILQTRFQDIVRQIQNQYKPLQQQHRELEAQYKQLQSRSREQQQTNRQLKLNIMQLESSNKTTEQTRQELQRNLRQCEQQLKINEQQCRQAQMQYRLLQQQLSQSRMDAHKLHEQTIQIQQHSHQAYTQIQQKKLQAEHEIQQYKETISNLSEKYRSLELQQNSSKQSMYQLQIRYTEIQTKSNILQSQLKMLQNHYNQLIQAHKNTQQQLIKLREILKKTEQERYFIQIQKQEDSTYFNELLKEKDGLINNFRRQLEQRINQFSIRKQQSQSKYNQLVNNSSMKYEEYQKKILNIQKQFSLFTQNNSMQCQNMYKQIQALTQNCLNLTNQKAEYQNKINNLQRNLGQKTHTIEEMRITINNYENRVNVLTNQIGAINQQMSTSRIVQHKQVESIVQTKNVRIQQLQNELIQRQQYYRRETNNLQVESERRQNQKIRQIEYILNSKIIEKQKTIAFLQNQLQQESQKYQQLVHKLQSILHTNQHHFQQILQYLEKIFQVNTELMVSVSKSNTNIINSANSQTYLMEQYHHSHSQDLNMFKNESLLLLGQLKDIMLREGDQSKARFDEQENRRNNKERIERKQKQDGLERQQRIIKYLQEQKQKSRNEKEQTYQKFRQIQQKIQWNSKQSMQYFQSLSQNLTQTIRQELSNNSNSNYNLMNAQQQSSKHTFKQSQQNIIKQNRDSNKYVHEITTNILNKMEGLTNLFIQNNQQYKSSVAQLQQSIAKLQVQNESLQKEIQRLRVNEIQLVSRHQQQKLLIQNRFNSQLHNISQLQHKNNLSSNQTQHLRRQLKNLQVQLERSHIQSNQMRKQYDIFVTQYEKTNNTLSIQLQSARRQIQRISLKAREKQQELYRIMTSSSARNPTKNSTTSLNSVNKLSSNENLQYQDNKHQVNSAIQRYEQKIVLLSQQIERLHRVIDNNQQNILGLERELRQLKMNQKTRSYSLNRSLNLVQNTYPQMEKELFQLREAMMRKNSEIQLIKSKLQFLQSQQNQQSLQNTQRTQRAHNDSYQFQILQLKHKLALSHQQNTSLQNKIDQSCRTVHALTQKIQSIKKSYKQMADYAEDMQNKILDLYAKYNKDLISRSSYEQSSHKLNENMISRIQRQNAQLKQKLNLTQIRYEETKQEFHKMEVIIQGLRQDNLELRKRNYQYQLQFQKVNFMKLKIGKLNNEVDRISQINIQLNQQVSQCRFAIGDEATIERTLFQNQLLIVLMAAQIQSLRSRVKDQSRASSRQRTKSKSRSNSINKHAQINNHQTSSPKINRVKSEQGSFKIYKPQQFSGPPIQSHSRQKGVSRDNLLYSFQKNEKTQITPKKVNKTQIMSLQQYNEWRKNEQKLKLGFNQSVNRSIVIQRESRHLDPNLRKMLRSSSREGSRDSRRKKSSSKHQK